MTLDDQIAATVREAVAAEMRAVLAELGIGLPRMSYTREEAAAVIGVGHSTVKKWVREGTLHASRIGGMVLIPHSEIERLLRENQTGGSSWEPHVVPAAEPGERTEPDRFSTDKTGSAGVRRRR